MFRYLLSPYNSSQFWNSFGMMVKENIFDKHFDNSQLTLTELLDDELIIGEFRNQNKKLMDFIQLPQMKELLTYITEMPTEEQNSKRAFRYPFYSSELLCCEVPKVGDTILGEDKTLLNQLFEFIIQPGEVNPVLAGYVSRVFSNLSKLKPDQYIIECFEQKNFITALPNQVQSRSIAEIIIKLLCIEKDKDSKDNDYIIDRIQLLKNTLNRIDDQDFEVSSNVSQIIQELLLKAYVIQNIQPLLTVLFQEYIAQLAQLATSQRVHVSLAATNIIYNLLNLAFKNLLRQSDAEETLIFNIDINELVNQLQNALPSWLEFIQQDTNKLGQNKIKMLEIIGFIINLLPQPFAVTLSNLNIFKILNELLVKYEKNNLFHLIYFRFIVQIIEQKIESLMKNLFETNQCINFFLTITQQEQNQINRKGYFGFITKLAKFFEDISNKIPYIQSQLDTEQWKQFKIQFYDESQKQSDLELGGHARADTNEDQDYHFNKEDIQNKYQDFLNTDDKLQQQPQTEVEQIQNIFEQFSINVASTEQQQQQQQQEQQIDWNSGWNTTNDNTNNNTQNQQWDSTPFENQQQDKQQDIHHNYAQDEAKEESKYWEIVHQQDNHEASHYWSIHHNEDSEHGKQAFEEFEKNL